MMCIYVKLTGVSVVSCHIRIIHTCPKWNSLQEELFTLDDNNNFIHFKYDAKKSDYCNGFWKKVCVALQKIGLAVTCVDVWREIRRQDQINFNFYLSNDFLGIFFGLNCAFNCSLVRSNYVILPLFYIVSSLGEGGVGQNGSQNFHGIAKSKIAQLQLDNRWFLALVFDLLMFFSKLFRYKRCF